MSVINKVLRDLDNRAGGSGRPPAEGVSVATGTQLPLGVVAVPPPPVYRRQSRRGWTVALLVLMPALGIGAAVWWWQGLPGAGAGSPAPVAAAVPVPAQPAPLPAASTVEPAAAAVPVAAAAPGAGASETRFPPGMARPEALAPLPAPVAPPAPVVVTAAPGAPRASAPVPDSMPAPIARQSLPAPTVSASAPVRLPATVPSAPVVPAAAPSPATAKPAIEIPPLAAPSPIPWPEAALDAVGQAQRMWGSGARDTALAFLRDALAGVERAHGPDLLPDRDGAAAGLAMVRELVRMEQTMGNHAQVLALLKRHEVLAARQSDLWAVRGSAAQRLSQHADAADAYRAALRLRPGEPRWMLGAAVSLAALGKLADATQLLEQARAIGPVSPEVLSYLRQLGVPARSDNQGN